MTTYPEGDDIVVSFGRNYPNRIDAAGNVTSSTLQQVNTLFLHVSKTESSYNVDVRKFSPQAIVTQVYAIVDNKMPSIVSICAMNDQLLRYPVQGINFMRMSDGTDRNELY